MAVCRLGNSEKIREDLQKVHAEIREAKKQIKAANIRERNAAEPVIRAKDSMGHTLTESELKRYQVLDDNPEAEVAMQNALKKNYDRSVKKVVEAVKSDMELLELADMTMEPRSVPEAVMSTVLAWNKGPGRILQQTNSSVGKWIAVRVFGHPEGRAGRMRAVETAAESQKRQLQLFQGDFQPKYRTLMWEHAQEQKMNPWKEWTLAETNEAVHPELKRIHRAAYEDLNNMRMGRVRSKEKVVRALADLVNESNRGIYTELSRHGLAKGPFEEGYAELKFEKVKIDKAIKDIGTGNVIKLFKEGFSRAKFDDKDAGILAKKLFEEVQRLGDDTGYRNTFQSKTDLLRTIDADAEMFGIKISDLLNTDLRTQFDIQARNAAGWIGLAKGTQGVIKTQTDIDVLKDLLLRDMPEDKEGKISQLMDDYMDRLFGRPVRGGLANEVRNFMNLATLSGMGKAGISQMVDSGQAAVRVIFNSHDINFVKKVKRISGNNKTEHALMQDIHAMTKLAHGLSELQNHARFEDTADISMSKAREMSLKVSNALTFGHSKSALLRGLGKLNLQDVVQKYQSRVIMLSYMLDIAKHFNPTNPGKGSMSIPRMMETGVCDQFGKDADLEAAFKHATWDADGLLENLNLDKWTEKQKDKLAYGIFKAESHEVQTTLISDLPNWINPVMWQAVTQFKEFSIVATNKQLLRQIKFADTESMLSVGINTALAALVKTAQFKIGAAGMNFIEGRELLGDIEDKQGKIERDIYRYNMLMGVFPDVYDFGHAAFGVSKDAWNGKEGAASQGGLKYLSTIPLVGLGEKFVAANGVSLTGQKDEQFKAVRGLLPYQNTILFGAIANFIEEKHKGE